MNLWMMQLGILIVCSALWGACGYLLGKGRANRWWEDEMIRRRHAVFHWENGKWYWNEDEPKTSRDPAATKVQKLFYSSTGGGSMS